MPRGDTPIPLPAVERILVRMPNWVGDVVMATPVLRALREHHPRAQITAAIRSYAAPILRASPVVDDVLLLEPADERVLRPILRLARRVAERRFDLAILLTNSFSSALAPFLGRVRVRAGYAANLRSSLLTHRVKAEVLPSGDWKPVPMPVFYQRILDKLGMPASGKDYVLGVPADAEENVLSKLRAAGWDSVRPLVALNPGAKFGSSKLWSSERFSELAARLRDDYGVSPLILCGPGEEPLSREIALRAGEGVLDSSKAPFRLDELAALMRRVRVLVTTDSGPRHFAVAMGRPVVVLMGPTFRAWTDWNLNQTTVLQREVPCGPCHLKTCPTDHRCMTELGVLDVLSATVAGGALELVSSQR